MLRKVVVLGANGAMGSSSGALFASAGFDTVFLARTREKAQNGQKQAEKLVKSTALSKCIRVGSYGEDLEREVADADLVFEAVAEDAAVKRTFLERVDGVRKADAVTATVSSGLGIGALCEGLSASFERNFLGIHFFNPPNILVGCELIAHGNSAPEAVAKVRTLLTARLGREVIEANDRPAFAGNRIAFKVLNEVAQLAEERGVLFMDTLMGPHTGRAMSPLITIDFVGWDVHKAIVDNLRERVRDESRDVFQLPAYMQKGINKGHLGRKTRDKGGFYQAVGQGKEASRFVLDPKSGRYVPLQEVSVEVPEVVSTMNAAIRLGRYHAALEVMCEAKGEAAELMRRIVLGYISYGLSLVGEVVGHARDIDRIMGFGLNWVPPSVLVDGIGVRRTIDLLERGRLKVPSLLLEAREKREPLFQEPHIDRWRFFRAKNMT